MLQRFRQYTLSFKRFSFWTMHLAIIFGFFFILRPIAWMARIKWRISRWMAKKTAKWSRTPSFAVTAILAVTFTILYSNFDFARAGTNAEDAFLSQSFGEAGNDNFSSAASAATNRSRRAGDRTSSAEGGMAINQQQALLLNKLMLEKAVANLSQFGDYTATFYKHERVQGSLLSPEVIEVKIREKPFSVYMRWLVGDKGRELLYINGQNDNNLLVHPGGVAGKLVSALSLARDSNMAMKENRYPIDKVGMLELSKILISYREQDLAGKTGAQVTVMDERTFEGYACYCFVVEYPDPARSPEYRKSILMIDKQNCLPIFCKNYTWPEEGSLLAGDALDKETLLEFYTYTNIKLSPQLADKEFDRNNEA
ncbi:MAG: DUF1571 domain-containing protein, partial [Planctomycetaceae bacterium]